MTLVYGQLFRPSMPSGHSLRALYQQRHLASSFSSCALNPWSPPTQHQLWLYVTESKLAYQLRLPLLLPCFGFLAPSLSDLFHLSALHHLALNLALFVRIYNGKNRHHAFLRGPMYQHENLSSYQRPPVNVPDHPQTPCPFSCLSADPRQRV